jgi:hypothetical protein
MELHIRGVSKRQHLLLPPSLSRLTDERGVCRHSARVLVEHYREECILLKESVVTAKTQYNVSNPPNYFAKHLAVGDY